MSVKVSALQKKMEELREIAIYASEQLSNERSLRVIQLSKFKHLFWRFYVRAKD